MAKRGKFFCYELRTQRRAHRLTQEALSDLSGGSPCHTQISRYERGEDLPPHSSDVKKLAFALCCSIAEKRRLLVAYTRDVLGGYGLDDQWVI